MKRTAFIIVELLLALCTVGAQTQDNAAVSSGNTRFIDRLCISLCSGIGSGHDNITPQSLDMTAGWRFSNRWSVFAIFGFNCAHYEKDDVRTYNDAPMLGGGVSYALVRGSAAVCVGDRQFVNNK